MILNSHIKGLSLSTRASNAILLKARCTSLGEYLQNYRRLSRKTTGVGPKTAAEIARYIKDNGLSQKEGKDAYEWLVKEFNLNQNKTPIDTLPLSSRARNCLGKPHGFEFFEDFLRDYANMEGKTHGMGPVTAKEIAEYIKHKGLAKTEGNGAYNWLIRKFHLKIQ